MKNLFLSEKENYKSDIVSATGVHDYKTAVTAATCTAEGYTTYTCSCGNTYKDDYVAATGHSHEAKTTAATCLADGKAVYTCKCGDSYTEVIKATGHMAGKLIEAVEIDCGKDGYIKQDYIFGWGAATPKNPDGSGGAAAAYRFQLQVDATSGKLHILSNYNVMQNQESLIADFVFKKEGWHHVDIVVDVKNAELTIYAGYWDADRTELSNYTLVCRTENMSFQNINHMTDDLFRFSDKKGATALDNIIVSVPVVK